MQLLTMQRGEGGAIPFSRSVSVHSTLALGVQLDGRQLHPVCALPAVHNLPEVAAAVAVPVASAGFLGRPRVRLDLDLQSDA